MLVRVLCIEDEDALETFFGPDRDPQPIQGAMQNAETLFSGDLQSMGDFIPDAGDTYVVNETEYNVIHRVFNLEAGTVDIFVHPIHFVEAALS